MRKRINVLMYEVGAESILQSIAAKTGLSFHKEDNMVFAHLINGETTLSKYCIRLWYNSGSRQRKFRLRYGSNMDGEPICVDGFSIEKVVRMINAKQKENKEMKTLEKLMKVGEDFQ